MGGELKSLGSTTNGTSDGTSGADLACVRNVVTRFEYALQSDGD